MLKKVLVILISIFLISEAAEFLDYNRAFRLSASYSGRMENMHGLSLGLNSEGRVGKSILEFDITPKLLFDINDYNNSDTSSNNETKFNNTCTKFKTFSLELALLFSHRPAIRIRNKPGSFTYNFWRYGICFELDIFTMETYFANGSITGEYLNTNDTQKRLGLIYKPAIGAQLTERLNLSIEIICKNMGEYGKYHLAPFVVPKFFSYGAGISLTISNPVSGFKNIKSKTVI